MFMFFHSPECWSGGAPGSCQANSAGTLTVIHLTVGIIWPSMILTGCCLSLSWHRALIVIFSRFGLGFFSGPTPAWRLTRWFSTSSEVSTCQLPQVQKADLSPFKNNSSSHVSKSCSRPAPPPPPTGVSPNDLDANVKFEFPFPSAVRIISLCHTWTPDSTGKISAG